MIFFANACPDPRTMMIILSNTSIAVFAMLRSDRLLKVTDSTISSFYIKDIG